MAFNLSRYNLSAFNIEAGNTKWIKGAGSELVTGSIGSAMEIYGNAIGYERVDESTSGDPVHYFTASGIETITEVVGDGQLTILLVPHFEEHVTAETDLQAEIMLTAPCKEDVIADTTIDSDIYLTSECNEIINASTALGSNVYLNAEGYELVSESTSLVAIEMKTCVLTVTLRPGQRIVIDSETYNVLLDSENAIDIHSGDWINELNRETTDITISAASGVANLSASILYTERYL